MVGNVDSEGKLTGDEVKFLEEQFFFEHKLYFRWPTSTLTIPQPFWEHLRMGFWSRADLPP